MSDPQPAGTRSFAVGAAIAVTLLMVTLCGGCTAFWLVGAVVGFFSHDEESRGLAIMIAPIALVVGGLPTLLFALGLRGAVRKWRGSMPPPSDPPPG